MKLITKFHTLVCLFLVIHIGAIALELPDNLSVAYSSGSGNWHNPSTWTWYANQGNSLGPLLIPNDSTFVIIQSGHTVTLGANARCESLVVEPNAVLDQATFELKLQIMGWAHGINDGGVDDGVPYFSYAPIDETWDITNPNNAIWTIYKVDGTHAGTGPIIFDMTDGTPEGANTFGFTVSGNGVISNTGGIYLRDAPSNVLGAKFNSACSLVFHGDMNLIDPNWPVNGGGNLTHYNFGTITMANNASIILMAEYAQFYNKPGGTIVVQEGNVLLAPLTAYYAFFENEGTVTLLNGDLLFSLSSYIQSDGGSFEINGDVLGQGLDSYFMLNANTVVSVTGAIFPEGNPGLLVSTQEPNEVIYSGTSPQEIIVPADAYTFSPPGSYSNLTINNSNAVATANADITITGDLTVKPGSALSVGASGSLSVGGSFTLESDASGTGSFITDAATTANVQRYIQGYTDAAHGWHFLSSPVAAQAISAFHTAGSGDDFYKWNEPTGMWINRTADGGGLNGTFESDFAVGTGYLVSYTSDDTKTFSGSLNIGNVSVTGLSNTPASAASGWHLLGNPFTSALVWNDGNWALNSVDANCQVWNEANASYTVITPNGIIPAMNGFMAHASADGASLTMPENSRTHDATNWYKNTDQNKQIVLTAQDIDGQTAQPTIIRFVQDATSGYDSQYDSYFLPGLAPMFYSNSQQQSYALNTLPELDDRLSITLGFVKNEGTHFVIELAENQTGQAVFLTDRKTQQTVKLSESDYTFTAEHGDDPNRFELHFALVGVEDISQAEAPLHVWTSNGWLYLQNEYGGSRLVIADVAGRIIQETKLSKSGISSIPINLTRGIYIVSLKTGHSVQSTKVFIQ